MVPKGCRVKGHPQGQSKSGVSAAVPHGVCVTESEQGSLAAPENGAAVCLPPSAAPPLPQYLSAGCFLHRRPGLPCYLRLPLTAGPARPPLLGGLSNYPISPESPSFLQSY